MSKDVMLQCYLICELINCLVKIGKLQFLKTLQLLYQNVQNLFFYSDVLITVKLYKNLGTYLGTFLQIHTCHKICQNLTVTNSRVLTIKF